MYKRQGDNSDNEQFFNIHLNNALSNISLSLGVDGGSTQVLDSDTGIVDGEFHHILYTLEGSNLSLYIDGKLEKALAITVNGSGINDPSAALVIGSDGDDNPVTLDDVAIWDRPLTSSEALELYLRGSNRVKFQIRSCDDSDCVGESFVGPDGTGSTYFSELYNTDTISSDIPQGGVKATYPIYVYSDFSSSPLDSQYFQYRVYLESADELSLCSGINCMPKVSSVEIAPTDRYYGGTYSFRSVNPIPLVELNSLSFLESSSCVNAYQLSPNGVDFYFLDSGEWKIASNDSERTGTNDIQVNLLSYLSKTISDELYIKGFMKGDNFEGCTIDEITIQIK